jgi:excisionase family DNA binding protein
VLRSPNLPRQLVGVQEVADFLDVSADWVYDRAAAGGLPCYVVGRQLRFDLDEVWGVVQTWRRGGPVSSRLERKAG